MQKDPEAFEPGLFFRPLEEACEGPDQALDEKMRTYPDFGAPPTAHPSLSRENLGVPPTMGGRYCQYTHCVEAGRGEVTSHGSLSQKVAESRWQLRSLSFPTCHEASKVSPESTESACVASIIAALPELSQIPALQPQFL